MNAKMVWDGLVLGESPRWYDGTLWVAGWAAHELITLDAAGSREVAERPDSVPCVRVREGGRVLALQVTVPSARSAIAGR